MYIHKKHLLVVKLTLLMRLPGSISWIIISDDSQDNLHVTYDPSKRKQSTNTTDSAHLFLSTYCFSSPYKIKHKFNAVYSYNLKGRILHRKIQIF